MIGAGTSLNVRTKDAISTTQDAAGKTYAAEITNDIVDQGGSLLVPKGSPVQLTVAAAPSGGTAAVPDLQLALLSMTVNGKTYLVNSASAEVGNSLGSQNRTTASTETRRGALLGTGADTGSASQVMTRGREVRIPANTMITFRLEQTIQLVGYVPSPLMAGKGPSTSYFSVALSAPSRRRLCGGLDVKLRIAIQDRVPIGAGIGERLAQLLNHPFRIEMASDVKVLDSTSPMFDHEETVEQLECDRRRGEEVKRHDDGSMFRSGQK